MLRWFRDEAAEGEVWGVDIAGDAIAWCQQHLSPPFRFLTTTTFPHLPFEDNYFDIVYAGSVFTHIADLQDCWLLELRRIVRPGGIVFVTVHDNQFIDAILASTEPRHAALSRTLRAFDTHTKFTASGFSMFAINRTPGHGAPGEAQVFYDLAFLQRHWGQYLRVGDIVPRALGGLQTGVVLVKRGSNEST